MKTFAHPELKIVALEASGLFALSFSGQGESMNVFDSSGGNFEKLHELSDSDW